MKSEVEKIIQENNRRNAAINSPFDPISGLGSVGQRRKAEIKGFPLEVQYLPIEMFSIPLIKKLLNVGVDGLLNELDSEFLEDDRQKIIEQFIRIRIKYDFPFWAAMFVYIKNKGGGEDVLFRLTRPQRRFVEKLEHLRKSGQPIRLVLLKARQWGGSTTSQLYMAWLQLVHKVGLNSLIIAHQGIGSDEIKDMFDRMIDRYPVYLLHYFGDGYNSNEKKLENVGKSGNISRVPQRNCKIKIGTAERPDSCRGGDYNLIHLSEVGIWKKTDGKTPEDIVRSACASVLYQPYTMIVYESTANGTGNFFQKEYDDAKHGRSQFQAMFISWFDIDLYSLSIDNVEEFAKHLYENKDNENVSNSREESGKYLWWLWQRGATLEGINWYIQERAKYTDHGQMASEFPSDDVEAFVHSGQRVFDMYHVEEFRKSCKPPKFIGEVYSDYDNGSNALKNLRFKEDHQGLLNIWELPENEAESDEIITYRYLTVVDVGGRSKGADFSVILVIDRLFLIDGGQPMVAAQWYGHIDMDLLAWKAAQIAAFYNNSLLVIESNTLETKDKERFVEGDQASFILSQIKDVYPNLYARRQSEEDIRQGLPRKYGFHTNVATKPMIISTLVKVVREHLYIERDERCLDEYLCYELKPNGSYGAIVGKHDDLLMTRAIGLHICFYEMDLPKIVSKANRTFSKTKRAISEASI